MTDGSVVQALAAERVIAILRYHGDGDVNAAVDALAEGGLRILEITVDGARAWPAIERAARDERLVIGAGTVTHPEDVERAASLGARFVVSPGLDVDVVAAAERCGVPVLPGVATATEVLAALRAGARMLKLFPAGAFGVDYLTDLRGPFRDVPFVPTGRIAVDDVASWLQAGALAVGLGAGLVGRTPPASPAERSALRERAREASIRAHDHDR